MIVSNIGITPDLSAIYTSNSTMDTAFVQVSLKEDHKTRSYAYMGGFVGVWRMTCRNVNNLLSDRRPGGFGGQPGTASANRYSGRWQRHGSGLPIAQTQCGAKIEGLKNVSDVLIPQDLRYPGLELNIDRERAA